MDWREMMPGDLRALCRHAGLTGRGTRAELIKRLDLHYHGTSDRHIHGRVICPYCRAAARCNGTRRMSETILRRTYRCQGFRRHSFTIDSTK
jgi:hypothetical protein